MKLNEIVESIKDSDVYKDCIASGIDPKKVIELELGTWTSLSEASVVSSAKAKLSRALSQQRRKEEIENTSEKTSGIIVGSTDRVQLDPAKKQTPVNYLILGDGGVPLKFSAFGENVFPDAPCRGEIFTQYNSTYKNWSMPVGGVISSTPISGYEFGQKMLGYAISASDEDGISDIYRDIITGDKYPTKIIEGKIRFVNPSPEFMWDDDQGKITLRPNSKGLAVNTNGKPTFSITLANEKTDTSVKVTLGCTNNGAPSVVLADIDEIIDMAASNHPFDVVAQCQEVQDLLFDRRVVVIGDVIRAEKRANKAGTMVVYLDVSPYGIFEAGVPSTQATLDTADTQKQPRKEKPVEPAKRSSGKPSVQEQKDAIAGYADALGKSPKDLSPEDVKSALPEYFGSLDDISIRTAINATQKMIERR